MHKTKSRKNKKQKGGFNVFGNNNNPQSQGFNSYGSNSYIQSMDNKLGSIFSNISSGVSNLWNRTKNSFSSSSSYGTGTSYGGKKTRKYKGGKGGLGLDYYATEVSGLKVAEPTYNMKYGLTCGGTKRKNKVKKTRKMRKHKGGKTF